MLDHSLMPHPRSGPLRSFISLGSVLDACATSRYVASPTVGEKQNWLTSYQRGGTASRSA